MLVAHARLLRGVYEAATLDGRPEWPPAPVRLFQALVAAAGSDPEGKQTLRWLEALPAPELRLARDVSVVDVDRWVPRNPSGERQKVVQDRVLHNRAVHDKRPFQQVRPSHPDLVFCWPDIAVDAAQLERLNRLAAQVTYVGRSTSRVMMRFRDEADAPSVPELSDVLVPIGPGQAAELELRVPYPGLADLLDLAFDTGQRAWDHTSVAQGYRRTSRPESPAVQGPWADMVAWQVVAPRHVDGRWAGEVTETLRAAVLSRFGHAEDGSGAAPGWLAGHTDDKDALHAAWLPLCNVGNRHADSRILGVATLFPREAPAAERVNAARLAGTVDALTFGKLTVRLAPPTGAPAWALQRRRWGGPASVWDTVTPVTLDRWPRKLNARGIVQQVIASIHRMGWPEPVSVRVGRTSPVAGASGLKVRRNGHSGAPPPVHLRIEFPRQVEGPVVLGRDRYFGGGLLVPASVPTGQDDTDAA